ncbi:MAG: chlorophyll synthase ChlG, partial [Prochlorothrix sp.]
MSDSVPDPKTREVEASSTETATPTTDAAKGAKARQLLGMKGAQPGETSIWKIRLQLMKPV